MPFPEVKRVLYRKNPLDQVICQFRFSPILKIDAEVPAQFQEQIRNSYPNLSESLQWEIPPTASGQLPPQLGAAFPQGPGTKNYEFSSEDKHWQINLTRSFMAFSTNNYQRWEEFKVKLKEPFDALIGTYNPGHFTRVGLRYVDVIRRSKLNLMDVPWSDLLQPSISGIIASPDIGSKVKNYQSVAEISLSDNRFTVRIATGLIQAIDSGESCFMIDSDFFNPTRCRVEEAFTTLDYFNSRSSRLIQWCITKFLHDAMEPQDL
jgi:uncharacterized protein (TIGR04255 family)